MVGIFDPACELLPPWTKELYLSTVSSLPSIWHPPPSPQSQTKCTVYTDCVWLWGGGGWRGGVELWWRPYSAGFFYTLFLTIFRTYKIAAPPPTIIPVKTTFRGWCLYSSFVHELIPPISPAPCMCCTLHNHLLQYNNSKQSAIIAIWILIVDSDRILLRVNTTFGMSLILDFVLCIGDLSFWAQQFTQIQWNRLKKLYNTVQKILTWPPTIMPSL
jgi:hypothetical protein